MLGKLVGFIALGTLEALSIAEWSVWTLPLPFSDDSISIPSVVSEHEAFLPRLISHRRFSSHATDSAATQPEAGMSTMLPSHRWTNSPLQNYITLYNNLMYPFFPFKRGLIYSWGVACLSFYSPNLVPCPTLQWTQCARWIPGASGGG